MAVENPRRRKLTQFVTHHILGNEYWNELLAVVYRKGQPYKLRQDSRAPGPCLYHLMGIPLCDPPYLSHEALLYERPFFYRPWHVPLLPYFLLLTISLSLVFVRLVRKPLVGIPHGVTGCLPPDAFPSPPPRG